MKTCLTLGLWGEGCKLTHMNDYFHFMYIIYNICSKEQDLVQTLSCLSMIITPAFAEVSTDSLALEIYLKKYSNCKCYNY